MYLVHRNQLEVVSSVGPVKSGLLTSSQGQLATGLVDRLPFEFIDMSVNKKLL